MSVERQIPLSETEIKEWISLAISSLCGDRIHFSTSDKAADKHRHDAKQVSEWVQRIADHAAEVERLREEFRQALATRDAEIARLYSERKPQ